MAASTYSTDLTTASDADSGTWAEPTATGWTSGATPGIDAENSIQNANAQSKAFNATGVGGMMVNYASGATVPTDGAILTWVYWASPQTLDTETNGGLRVMAGNALNAFKGYKIGGKDTYSYGGWLNAAFDPAQTADYTLGSPTGSYTYLGMAVNNLNAITKGNPCLCDAIRFGRCEIKASGGDSGNGYATFSSMAAKNDANDGTAGYNRWGLFSLVDGTYKWKGLMSLGSSTVATSSRARTSNVATIVTSTAHKLNVGDTVTVSGLGGTGYNVTATVASVTNTTTFTYSNTGTNEGTTSDTGGTVGCIVDFRDSNRNIVIENTKKVSSAFNLLEVKHASSRVDFTNINITALGTTSRGNVNIVDDADINWSTCVFTDMGTFTFKANSTVLSSTFRRCNLITTGGATFTGCTFDSTNDSTKAVTASSPANAALITNSTFVSSGTKHGLEITGTAANMTLTNVTWTGYAASDGSTGNEAVYVNIASGSMNLTISGGSTPSVRTAGATVTIISGAVNATLKAVTSTGTAIQDAQVMVKAASGGPFPYNVTVTISNSGTTATVTHTAHGMATNDKVLIKGASLYLNNGVFTITKINNDSYSYTMDSAPGSSPTGTITSTFVALYGTTNVSGEITMSRVFNSNQPVTGWARKSTSSPYYKTGQVSGTISSSTGAYLTALLISDE